MCFKQFIIEYWRFLFRGSVEELWIKGQQQKKCWCFLKQSKYKCIRCNSFFNEIWSNNSIHKYWRKLFQFWTKILTFTNCNTFNFSWLQSRPGFYLLRKPKLWEFTELCLLKVHVLHCLFSLLPVLESHQGSKYNNGEYIATWGWQLQVCIITPVSKLVYDLDITETFSFNTLLLALCNRHIDS